jgi:hypothetical protein
MLSCGDAAEILCGKGLVVLSSRAGRAAEQRVVDPAEAPRRSARSDGSPVGV